MRTYERGQILPLVGLAAFLLVAMAGFAADVGYHQYEQRLQQTAADSAALAGAADLIARTDVTSGARRDAQTNGFADNSGGACPNDLPLGTICVIVHTPPQSGAYSGSATAVEVIIKVAHPTFFERIFNSKVVVSTRAVAITATVNPCIVLLSTADSSNFNKSDVTGTNCRFVSNNSSVNFNKSTVNVAGFDCYGACTMGSGANFTPLPTHISIPASDPCPQISGCGYLANSAPAYSGCTSFTAQKGAPANPPPGCYSALDVHQASTVTFSPGLYVITGQLDAHGLTALPAGVNGNGVTFYITGSGTLDFHASTLNLSAPTTGDYSLWSHGEQNVLFYQTPSDTNGPNFQTASCSGGNPPCVQTLNGLLYFPTAAVNYNKTEGGYNVLVFGSGNFNKSDNTYGPTGAQKPFINIPMLAE